MPLSEKKDFDTVVVGSGPNGLAAAITLQQEGLSVLLIEGKDTIGGGLRTASLTLPDFHHDICSAIHPLAAASPFFSKLPLRDHGLTFIYPTIAAAHPFDDGTAAIVTQDIAHTAAQLGADEKPYRNLVEPLVTDWNGLIGNILGPLTFPKKPFALARFGLKALPPATFVSRVFKSAKAKGLWAGMAAHSIIPLSHPATSAIGLVLLAAAHHEGWPVPKGGSQQIANALASYFTAIGGKIETSTPIRSLSQLPSSQAVILDVTPRQLLSMAGERLSSFYRWQLQRFKYGMGVFKIDFALREAVPWRAAELRHAGTVHLGSTFEEIARSEHQSWKGIHPEKPYVLVAQQSLLDNTRAPEGKHTLWAYCHVPSGSTVDMTQAIENQIERYAPGFRDIILAKHTFNTGQMEDYNPNYVGGDINGGAISLSQLFTRPVLKRSPYRTSAKGIYLCSSSTPPGGGVHGMCGYHAANRALRDIFHIHSSFNL